MNGEQRERRIRERGVKHGSRVLPGELLFINYFLDSAIGLRGTIIILESGLVEFGEWRFNMQNAEMTFRHSDTVLKVDGIARIRLGLMRLELAARSSGIDAFESIEEQQYERPDRYVLKYLSEGVQVHRTSPTDSFYRDTGIADDLAATYKNSFNEVLLLLPSIHSL